MFSVRYLASHIYHFSRNVFSHFNPYLTRFFILLNSTLSVYQLLTVTSTTLLIKFVS